MRLMGPRFGAPVGSESWWAHVALAGTPLTTRLDDARTRVTFLWRDPHGCERRSSIRRVLIDVVSVTDHHRSVPEGLTRVPGTDVWFWSVDLESDWRGAYCFIPLADDLPPGTTDRRARWLSLLACSEPDPLNPIEPHAGAAGQRLSAAHLPDAPFQPEWGGGGDLDTARPHRLSWDSRRLGNTRRVWVHDTGGSDDQPLVLMLDGGYWAEAMPIFAALERATRTGRLPGATHVLIDAVDRETRSRELTCDDAFWEAVQHELLPLVAGSAAVTQDPGRTVVAGQSFGGLAALHAGLRRPGRFGKVLSQSGSFWWRDQVLIRDVEAAGTAPAPLDIFLEAGSHEAVILPVNRRLHGALAQAGHTSTFRVYSGGHDPLCWRGGMVDGLSLLLESELQP